MMCLWCDEGEISSFAEAVNCLGFYCLSVQVVPYCHSPNEEAVLVSIDGGLRNHLSEIVILSGA